MIKKIKKFIKIILSLIIYLYYLKIYIPLYVAPDDTGNIFKLLPSPPGSESILFSIYMLFCLSLIWFPKYWGEFTGFYAPLIDIDKKSSPRKILLIGWILFLTPLLVALYFFIINIA